MNEITPANEIPPAQRTAASGTLPTEQTNASTATTGPRTTFSSSCPLPPLSVRKSPLKKSIGSSAMKPAIRKPAVISFQSICASPRKLWATSDHASSERNRDRAACGVVLVPGAGGERALSRLLLLLARHEQPDPEPHESDQKHAADELGEGELPADEDPEHDSELEDEVRRGELEHHRAGEAAALLEDRLRDRDSCVAARRRGRAEPCRERDRAGPAAAERPFHPLPRHPRLHDPGEQEPEHERPPDLPRHLEGVPEPWPIWGEVLSRRDDGPRRHDAG